MTATDYTPILRRLIATMGGDVDPVQLESAMRTRRPLEGLTFEQFRHEALTTMESLAFERARVSAS